jgi:LacI family gluconate utilization system Gnt-I transcriptional repressor
MNKKNPTIIDVAKLANVGTMSVSRYFKNTSLVSRELQLRIGQAAKNLSYSPNPIASSLASRNTNIIPIYIPYLRFAAIHYMRSINKILQKEGFQNFLLSNDGITSEEKMVDNILKWNPRGLIIVGNITSRKVKKKLKEIEIPIVETATNNPIDLFVGFDFESAGAKMAEYLIKNKYKKIAFVGTSLESKSLYTTLIFNGFNKTLEKNNIKLAKFINYKEREKDQLIEQNQNPGADSMKSIYYSKKNIEVVVYSDDLFALDAHIFCKKNDIRIKKDISLVTFSGTIPETFDVNPAITSIDMDHKNVGLKAAELLLKKINGKDHKKINYISSKFIEGGSA